MDYRAFEACLIEDRFEKQRRQMRRPAARVFRLAPEPIPERVGGFLDLIRIEGHQRQVAENGTQHAEVSQNSRQTEKSHLSRISWIEPRFAWRKRLL